MNNAATAAGRLLLASLFAPVMLLSPILASPALADIIADAGGPYTGVLGGNVQFRGTAVTDGGRVARYQWDFGDFGSGSSPGATINHKYLSTGEFTVTLTVVDIDGFTSEPVTTTATIVEPTSTTTTTTQPTTTTSTPSPTTTSTTTTSPTSSSTTTLPTTTSTSLPTGSTATTTPTTSLPRRPIAVNTSTTSATATTVEASPAEGLSATAFSLVPPTAFVGGEIALSVVLAADTPGKVTVQFLLDGRPLGEAVTLDAREVSNEPAVGAVFTRTLPSDVQTGSHLVEVVTAHRPPQVLASRKIEVVAAILPAQEGPNALPPSPTSPNRPGLIVAMVLSGAVAIPTIGFGVSTLYRRKTIVRRIGGRG